MTARGQTPRIEAAAGADRKRFIVVIDVGILDACIGR